MIILIFLAALLFTLLIIGIIGLLRDWDNFGLYLSFASIGFIGCLIVGLIALVLLGDYSSNPDLSEICQYCGGVLK